MKVLGVSGYHHSGKTTAVVAIIKELKKRKYKVVSIKDIHNQNFSVDKIGSNSWEHWKASNDVVVARGLKETYQIWHKQLNLNDMLYHLKADYVVVEGMYEAAIPKIICAKNESELDELIDDNVLAISGIYADNHTTYKDLDVYKSQMDIGKIVDLIEEKVFDVLPQADPKCCSECGLNCYTMVGKILKGERKREDCIADRHEVVELFIEDQKIKIVPFVQRILRDSISSIVRNLDNCEKGSISIKINK